MRRSITLTLLMMISLNAVAATKDSGTTTLKEIQPAGTTDKKQKHQRYDLSFVSSKGMDYTCRTGEKTSVKATDFVVGSTLKYQVNGDKAKVKTSAGKEVSCVIVRVANAAPTAPK
jgi:hypothetical protein